ncbi:MAG: diguanylate cyclase protein [Rhodocyclaceae bacterium]|nr:diguanylate cyclase protein [Rhodocyclaceae bacterium]
MTGAGGSVAPRMAWRLLLVEDSDDDAELIRLSLEQAGLAAAISRVSRREDLCRCLEEGGWDAVVCDHHLPDLDSLRALELVAARQAGLPFILVSGAIPDELAAEVLRRGARDFISKGDLGKLPAALGRELS